MPAVRRGLPEVLHGHQELDRRVRWAHVAEVPNLQGELNGNELILTTGIGPGIDARQQRKYVRQLVAHQAAALVIEIGTVYPSGVPAAILQEAMDGSLPVIALHRRVPFVDLTEAVHVALIELQNQGVRRSAEIQDEFLDLLVEGGGTRDVLNALAARIGNPVVFENAGRQLIAHVTHQADDDLTLAAWDSYSLRGEGTRTGVGALEAEVFVLGRIAGRLIALEVDGPLDELAQITLTRAATMVSLELRRRHYEEQLQAESRGLFLADLSRGAMTEHDAAHRAAAQGFTPRPGQMLPVVASWRSGRWQSLGATMERAWAALLPTLKQACSMHSRAVIIGQADADLLAVLDVDQREIDTGYLGGLAESIRRALERRGLDIDDLTIAFGPSELTWSALAPALRATCSAAGVARALPPRPWHDARRSSVADFIFAIRSSPELLHFIDRQLGALLGVDKRRSRALLDTLETYLAKGGRVTETARALHLERQSLYSRLRKIEALLDVDLGDGDVFLSLHLACRARQLLGEFGQEDWA